MLGRDLKPDCHSERSEESSLERAQPFVDREKLVVGEE
jgi:hypothetical protein